MAEQVAALLAPVLGPTQAHDLVARASASAALAGQLLADALTTGETGHTITTAGITKAQLSDALDPAAYPAPPSGSSPRPPSLPTRQPPSACPSRPAEPVIINQINQVLRDRAAQSQA